MCEISLSYINNNYSPLLEIYLPGKVLKTGVTHLSHPAEKDTSFR